MNRYIKMTPTAQQATWTMVGPAKGESTPHIPTQWLVQGDKKDGYTVYAVNDDVIGFPFITMRSLHAAKSFITEVNETGHTTYEKHCTLGSFSWRNHPIPKN